MRWGGGGRSVATISSDRVSSAVVAVAITLTAALACGNVNANEVFYTANAANVLSLGIFPGLWTEVYRHTYSLYNFL